MTGSVRRRAHDEQEQTAASPTGRRRTDPPMETEETHFGQEQQVPNPDPNDQRLEAQMLRDAISGRMQIETTDLLDQIYAEITGLAAPSRRPYPGPTFVPHQGQAFPAAYMPQQTMPSPMPATHDPIDMLVPTEHIPDEALITWGEAHGQALPGPSPGPDVRSLGALQRQPLQLRGGRGGHRLPGPPLKPDLRQAQSPHATHRAGTSRSSTCPSPAHQPRLDTGPGLRPAAPGDELASRMSKKPHP